ncbi:flavin-containing monooxygenase [Brevibacterium yomogidense]|uniref:Cyclohexanone monooxygenase n=1 Tax=Brevibacterium yomogidense TaxID=946573 RepID=A0A1X6XAA1_9MICO|nr:NAD(P)/FAD-dependent oxidoreductase [Brevibacterium yomogidense]SLM96128.1 Cyclohexanone monooxygenase [Brevibacterium yomogidense]
MTATENQLDLLQTLEFDIEALRQKYQHERERRIRPEGDNQYFEVSGKFAKYDETDPYADPNFTRDPVTEETEVLVLGGGFSGLLASARLMEAGVEDFKIIDAAGDFGGTWYWNRYPGAQCDIESYCYLPLLEELDYMPKEKYSYVDEIFEYAKRIGRHYGLYERAYFHTRVRQMRWDDTNNHWLVSTDRNDDIRARFVVSAIGPASRPKLPGIPGIHDFEGHSFHTSRWDYDYTGGDTTGGMTKLGDKKVAIIGTGATAIQSVPRTAEYAEHLYVFQRTPSAVCERGNKPTDPEWWNSLQPGWQQERRDNFGALLTGEQRDVDLVQDGWTVMAAKLREMPPAKTMEELALQAEIIDFRRMNEIRDRVDETITDPELAETLKPYYKFLCKRPTFNDEYLPAFNRDNVTLVDVSDNKGVERITPKGIVANGKEYEVDCIIYASGFEILTQIRRRIGYEVIGRDGRSLVDEWDKEMRTLHGFTSRGYPNWFFIGLSQNAPSVNMTFMFDEQARHISYIIGEAKRRGAATVEPTQQAQDDWVAVIQDSELQDTYYQDCTPGYYNNEGTESAAVSAGFYGPGIVKFNALLAEWREEGSMKGLELASGKLPKHKLRAEFRKEPEQVGEAK